MIKVLNSFWALEFEGHFFKPWRFWNLLGISIWDLGFRTLTDGQMGSGFQDLDGQTGSGFQDLDIRTNGDLGFRTSTNGQTRSGFQDLDEQTDRLTELIYRIESFVT